MISLCRAVTEYQEVPSAELMQIEQNVFYHWLLSAQCSKYCSCLSAQIRCLLELVEKVFQLRACQSLQHWWQLELLFPPNCFGQMPFTRWYLSRKNAIGKICLFFNKNWWWQNSIYKLKKCKNFIVTSTLNRLNKCLDGKDVKNFSFCACNTFYNNTRTSICIYGHNRDLRPSVEHNHMIQKSALIVPVFHTIIIVDPKSASDAIS